MREGRARNEREGDGVETAATAERDRSDLGGGGQRGKVVEVRAVGTAEEVALAEGGGKGPAELNADGIVVR